MFPSASKFVDPADVGSRDHVAEADPVGILLGHPHARNPLERYAKAGTSFIFPPGMGRVWIALNDTKPWLG